jgi:hypothetical protein
MLNNSIKLLWILIGLRTFWVKVIVLKPAAMACCKQYCLRSSAKRSDELYCVGRLKNKNPKMFCSLDFLWLLSCVKTRKQQIKRAHAEKRYVLTEFTPKVAYPISLPKTKNLKRQILF